MAEIVLFHSALGLTPGAHRFADAVRGAGHTVTMPDLYEGAVFEDLAEGVAMVEEVGIPELVARATTATASLPNELVYAGFSMGTAPALVLATARPGARGVLLMHGAIPLEVLGVGTWPTGLPVQVHTSPGDPWMEPWEIEGLTADVPPDLWEHFEYPGTGHLFTDSSSPDHDPEALATLLVRANAFLDRIDGAR